MTVLGVPGIVLMENAAIGCVALLRELAGPSWPKVAVDIVCGSGNNGGDGYAIARHLLVAGAAPRLRPFAPPRAGSDAATNAGVARAMGIPFVPVDSSCRRLRRSGALGHAERSLSMLDGDLLVDALFGTGLDRAVDSHAAEIVEAMNEFDGPVLAVDVPSGLDADTGEPLGVAVRATATATMVAPKRGFTNPESDRYTGRIVVVSIGVPPPS